MRSVSSLWVVALFVGSAAQDDLEKEVAGLTQKLKSADPKERMQAEDRLVELGSKARPYLEKLARAGDVELALRIGMVLATIEVKENPRAPGIKDLVSGYANRGDEGRTEIIRKLMAYPSEEATTALVEIATTETAVKVKKVAVDALGYRRHKEARETLEKLLDDATSEVRARSMLALRNAGVRAEIVAKGLADPDAFVREAAGQCVELLDDDAAIPLVAEMLKEEVRGSVSEKILDRAFKLALRYRHAKLVAPIAANLRGVRTNSQRLRALNTLLLMRIPQSAVALLAAVEVERATYLELDYVEASIVDTHDPSTIPGLITALRSDSLWARHMAARCLTRLAGEFGCPGPKSRLISPLTLGVSAAPPDEKAKAVADGEWNEIPWRQVFPDRLAKDAAPTELKIDLGREARVHSIRVIVATHTDLILSVSIDGKTFTLIGKLRLLVQTNGCRFILNRPVRVLKFESTNLANALGADYREVMVYEMEEDDLVAAWEAWWKSSKEKLEAHGERSNHARRVLEAQEAWERGDPGQALEALAGFVKDVPGCLRAKRLRGALRQVRGDPAGAIADLEESTRALSDDWRSEYYLAAAWASRGKTKESLDALERAVKSGLSDDAAFADAAFGAVKDDPRFKKLRLLIAPR